MLAQQPTMQGFPSNIPGQPGGLWQGNQFAGDYRLLNQGGAGRVDPFAAGDAVRARMGLPSLFGGGGGGTPRMPSMGQPPEGGWGGPAPTLGGVDFPEMLEGPGPTPTEGWYEGLDENVRAGIEEPFERGMESLWERLAGGGTLGSPRAGVSGAAADVMADYQTQAAPMMAQSAWNMMLPGMMMPYEAAMSKYATESQRAMQKYQTEAGIWGQRAQMGYGGAQTQFGGVMQDYMARLQDQMEHEEERDWRPKSEFERTWGARFGSRPAWAPRKGMW